MKKLNKERKIWPLRSFVDYSTFVSDALARKNEYMFYCAANGEGVVCAYQDYRVFPKAIIGACMI